MPGRAARGSRPGRRPRRSRSGSRRARTNDFELFRPYLERNVELRREYAACFEVDEPYDALLDDFEPGMKTAEVREVFARLKEGLVPLIAEASDAGDRRLVPRAATSRSSAAGARADRARPLRLPRGHAGGSTRSSIRSPPRSATHGHPDDDALPRGRARGIFAAMHEGGHGLYEHNVDPALERTPLCRGTSLALHESQSRMWENLVGRSLPFWRWVYPQRAAALPDAARRRRARATSTARSTRSSRR